MAKSHEIELFIDEEGGLKVHIKGIRGGRCVDEMEKIVKEMGTETSRELTPEYYLQPDTLSTDTKIKPK